MSKNILTIAIELASDDVHYEDFTSKTSLLDWDIILFKPMIGGFLSHYGEEYQGKPCLNESSSFQLKESCEHWRREIRQAVENGKTVIVFLEPLQEIYIDSGKREYSGTGRNQRTTRIVAPYTNYSCLPVDPMFVNAKGTAIKLPDKGAEFIAPYWSEFGSLSEYQVLLTAENIPACLVTRNGSKVVGAVYRSKNSNGALVLLPNIDFYPDNFLKKEGKEDVWTSAATKFAARLIKTVVSLDQALHSSGEVTPQPAWAEDQAYSLVSEQDLRIKLLNIERVVEDAQRRKEDLLEKLRAAGRIRGLLYEKGKPLEQAIIEALQLLGYKATSYKDASSEFDVVFESDEGRLIGEAEGKDNKPVNVDKLRQLAMNIHEDLQREEITIPAKGVLFGNGFRLLALSVRQEPFTEKCITAAKASSVALVATVDLFKVAQHLSNNPDESFAKLCREAILSAAGRVVFPEPPHIDVNVSHEVKE